MRCRREKSKNYETKYSENKTKKWELETVDRERPRNIGTIHERLRWNSYNDYRIHPEKGIP